MDIQTLTTKILTLGTHYGLPRDFLNDRPNLFSAASVDLSAQDRQTMQAIIAAAESVIALPEYRNHVLTWAAPNAIFAPSATGILFSYDFHLTPTGPQLIEINTNAGGAGLDALLNSVHASEKYLTAATEKSTWEQAIITMFLTEWKLQHKNLPLQRITIVDDQPTEQYLYPDFLVFQTLLSHYGLEVIIADSNTLHIKNNKLYYENLALDFVYNRLTDFSLSEPRHAALKTAYLDDLVVLTPHPHAYALYADKRNLTVLTNATLLKTWHVPDTTIKILQSGIPHTFLVNQLQSDLLWTERKTLFFKPINSYGGKGVYRGQNITRKVFAEVIANQYIAQTLVPPSQQEEKIDAHETARFKVDIRNYVYQGKTLSIGARLYRGQATNFRLPGAGFAYINNV